jgi:hypothetical protein
MRSLALTALLLCGLFVSGYARTDPQKAKAIAKNVADVTSRTGVNWLTTSQLRVGAARRGRPARQAGRRSPAADGAAPAIARRLWISPRTRAPLCTSSTGGRERPAAHCGWRRPQLRRPQLRAAVPNAQQYDHPLNASPRPTPPARSCHVCRDLIEDMSYHKTAVADISRSFLCVDVLDEDNWEYGVGGRALRPACCCRATGALLAASRPAAVTWFRGRSSRAQRPCA